MHAGRISDPAFLDGQAPVAPSPVQAEGTSWTDDGPKPLPR